MCVCVVLYMCTLHRLCNSLLPIVRECLLVVKGYEMRGLMQIGMRQA